METTERYFPVVLFIMLCKACCAERKLIAFLNSLHVHHAAICSIYQFLTDSAFLFLQSFSKQGFFGNLLFIIYKDFINL